MTVEAGKEVAVGASEAEKVAKEASETAKQAVAEMNVMKGQLSVLAAAATGPAKEEEVAPDIMADTEAALTYHVNKRTKPLIDESNRRAAAQALELTQLKHGEDWKEFGTQVERMIEQNGISIEVLASPGAYEKLLNHVKAENIDAIVSKKVQQAQAAAALASPAGKETPLSVSAEANKPKMNDQQKRIALKMGISEADWLKSSENTTDDGIWIRGAV